MFRRTPHDKNAAIAGGFQVKWLRLRPSAGLRVRAAMG
jgi:hypothetical protein